MRRSRLKIKKDGGGSSHSSPRKGGTSEPLLPAEEMDTPMQEDALDNKPDVFSCLEKFMRRDSSSGSFVWAPDLLEQCASAIHSNDSPKVQYAMWVLNELASPYGDCEQRLASAFLQALFARLAGNGRRYYNSLCAASAMSHSFHSMKKTVLKFQELSPWMTACIAAANGAVLEALSGERAVHILDISNNFCTQWPTLFEALAMRADYPPHLRLTTFSVSKEATPFEFRVLQEPDIESLDPSALDIRDNEALIINSFHSLQHSQDNSSSNHQDKLMDLFHKLKPKAILVVEDEVDLTSPHFTTCFKEAFRFYSMFFETLDNSFPRTSSERLMLERSAGRKLVAALACEDALHIQKCAQWGLRMKQAGFIPKPQDGLCGEEISVSF